MSEFFIYRSMTVIGTIINTTIEYTHRGSSAGLEEHALRFTIGASIAENWFFKLSEFQQPLAFRPKRGCGKGLPEDFIH